MSKSGIPNQEQLNPPTGFTALQEVSVLPGRVRFKDSRIMNNKMLAQYTGVYMDNLKGVKRCSANHNTGSILITYDIQKTGLKQLKLSTDNAIRSIMKNKNTVSDKYAEYFNKFKELNKAKRKVILFGGIYLLYKIKQSVFGKFSLSRNVEVLKFASAVTVIGGYPLLKSIYRRFAKKVPADSDILLTLVAVSFTLLRESSKGVLVLALKALSDYMHLSAEAESIKLLNQSLNEKLEEEGLSNRVSTVDSEGSELAIQKEVLSYQNTVTPFSLGAGAALYLVTGSILRSLSLMLVLNPSASATAVKTGIKNYISLSGRNGIYIKNFSVLEKIQSVKYVIINMKDKLSGLADLEDRVGEEYFEVIRRLKMQGMKETILLTGDGYARVKNISEKLEVEKAYSSSNCDAVRKLVQEYKGKGSVMIAGDNVNELGVMEAEDVSVWFAHSADGKVKFNSDCVIFEDNILRLSDLVLLTKSSYSIIKQNLTVTRVYNTVMGILALFGRFDAFTAKSLNTLNSLIVLLLNKRIELISPRILYEKSTL